MGRYNHSHYRSYGHRSIGQEKALEHIREAEELTRELGGTDEDVKRYFFSLPQHKLNNILTEYEKEYGKSARAYAIKTISSWESGTVHMSGLVAGRLFKLLPPTMPIATKFQLVESLWKHVGPSSTKNYNIGLDDNLEDLTCQIKKHLEDVVINYSIPSSLESRFNWLSQGDVGLKQQLLNHFRQQEKMLLAEALRTQLPILLSHLNSGKGSLTTHAAQVLKVGKHEVRVTINKRGNGVSSAAPIQSTSRSDYSWVLWLIGIIIFLWLCSR